MDGYAYIDIARPGESNMAIDRELLEAAERQHCAWVRLYRWSGPTLSLGRFQATVDRSIHAPSAQLPSVLRASGGGAIVHHHEWTYSVAAPVGKNKVGAAPHLYDIVHDALVAGLQRLGWDATKWTPGCSGTSQVSAQSAPEPSATGCSVAQVSSDGPHFLCFSRRACGDIVSNGFKVVGSAQRRLGSSVLQHGSILFARSDFAPELPGLLELPRSSADPVVADPMAAARTSHQTPNEFLSREHFESARFAELVLSWLIAALGENLGVSFQRLPAPPEQRTDLECQREMQAR